MTDPSRAALSDELEQVRQLVREHIGPTMDKIVKRAVAALRAPLPGRLDCGAILSFQKRVLAWLMECFSNEVCRDGVERNHRFIEESLELVQSLGCTRSEAHQLVDYVFDRPVGEPMQELGGVQVTLSALASCHDMDLSEAGETELARVWTKIEKIRAKQLAKPKHSPLPALPPTLSSGAVIPITIIEPASAMNGGAINLPSGRTLLLSKEDADAIISLPRAVEGGALSEQIRSIADDCREDFNTCPQCGYEDHTAIKNSNLLLLIDSALSHPNTGDGK